MKKGWVVLLFLGAALVFMPTEARAACANYWALTLSNSPSCSRQNIAITNWPAVMSEVTDQGARLDLIEGLIGNMLQCFYYNCGSLCSIGTSWSRSGAYDDFTVRPADNRFIPTSFGGWETTSAAWRK